MSSYYGQWTGHRRHTARSLMESHRLCVMAGGRNNVENTLIHICTCCSTNSWYSAYRKSAEVRFRARTKLRWCWWCDVRDGWWVEMGWLQSSVKVMKKILCWRIFREYLCELGTQQELTYERVAMVEQRITFVMGGQPVFEYIPTDGLGFISLYFPQHIYTSLQDASARKHKRLCCLCL